MAAWISILALLTVTAASPGPNNTIVLSAGARGGLRAALPGMAGILGGGLLLLILTWWGLDLGGDALATWSRVLPLLGSVYLAWLGLGLLCTVGEDGSSAPPLPSRFPAVALFQFTNPKAWALAVSVVEAASRQLPGWRGLALLAGLFLVVSATCLLLWSLAGRLLGRMLGQGRGRLVTNRVMGSILIATALFLATSALAKTVAPPLPTIWALPWI